MNTQIVLPIPESFWQCFTELVKGLPKEESYKLYYEEFIMRPLTDEEFEDAHESCEHYGYWTCPECGNNLEPDANCEDCQISGYHDTLFGFH